MTDSSIDYLYQGDAGDFIETLEREIEIHPALNHPFLAKLGDGKFADTPAVLRDYAYQYSVYSEWFTRYLDGVIKNLDREDHVAALMENLEEEKGNPDSPNLEDRPHVELFARFKDQVGADQEYCDAQSPCTTVLLWRDLFLQKCHSDIRGVGLAAIGLGTEYIISRIYPGIISAIENYTELGSEGSLFFRLHVKCDDNHADVLKNLTREVAEDVSTREAIRFGVFSSLNLRKAFWDAALARAVRLGVR